MNLLHTCEAAMVRLRSKKHKITAVCNDAFDSSLINDQDSICFGIILCFHMDILFDYIITDCRSLLGPIIS